MNDKINNQTNQVIVIGGGPAGLMAAGRAAELGARVLLLEKNSQVGQKLLITGGGRCNFTNAEADISRLAAQYGQAHKALLSPFSKFSSRDCLDFFSGRGLAWQIEDQQRAFPQSNTARSVLAVLERYVQAGQVRVCRQEPVVGLERHRHSLVVQTKRRRLPAPAVIVACGGTARPETGSTGDGFNWLAKLGHAVRYPQPSLVPVAVGEPWIGQLQGLAFNQIAVTVVGGQTSLLRQEGKVLFTHFGLSGPLILNMANQIAQAHSQFGPVTLSLDFFPGQTVNQLDQALVEHCAGQPAKLVKNAFGDLVPPRLVKQIIVRAAIDAQTRLGQLRRDQRQAIVYQLKKFNLSFAKLMDESWAVVASGGVAIDQIDFRTMTSRIVPNLAIVGDLLDINRPSGGYSLQLCWATGWVAGTWAANQTGIRL